MRNPHTSQRIVFSSEISSVTYAEPRALLMSLVALKCVFWSLTPQHQASLRAVRLPEFVCSQSHLSGVGDVLDGFSPYGVLQFKRSHFRSTLVENYVLEDIEQR
jgi:hypothetical protein